MRYNIPKQFNQEATYLIFFTKKSLIYTCVGLAVGFPILFFLTQANHQTLGIILWIIIALPFYILGRVYFPKDLPFNGGEPLDKVVWRKLRRLSFFGGKCLYLADVEVFKRKYKR